MRSLGNEVPERFAEAAFGPADVRPVSLDRKGEDSELNARERTYYARQELRKKLPRSAADHAKGWTQATYPTAQYALVYWLLFGEEGGGQSAFSQAYFSQFGTQEQRFAMRERYTHSDGPLAGTPVISGRRLKAIRENWLPRGVVSLRTIDQLYTDMGIELINVDPRAWIAPPSLRKSERLLRKVESLPAWMSEEEIAWLVEKAMLPQKEQDVTAHTRWIIESMIYRFMEVQARDSLRDSPEMRSVMQALLVPE